MSDSLPSPVSVCARYPLTNAQSSFIHASREEISRILSGKDQKRSLLIVGPCSVHHVGAMQEYAKRLKALSKEVEECFFIVIRAYVEKPRTSLGWRGFIIDPHLDGSCCVTEGIEKTRALFQFITSLELPIGCEILDPCLHLYYSDYLSWGCIGARTSSSPPHRHLASTFPFPMGFKNSVDGSIEVPLHAIKVASQSHVLPVITSQGKLDLIKSRGNPLGHLVLRGSSKEPNYSSKHILQAQKEAHLFGFDVPIVVDCSHDNSRKFAQFQIPIFHSVCDQLSRQESGVNGVMLESFLEGGTQSLVHPKPSVSITDPCLGWEETRELILREAEKLSKKMPLTIPFQELTVTY